MASIGFPALTPTWGGSLGHPCKGSWPIVLQKGHYQLALDALLSLLLDSRPERRTLTMLRDRGLVIWGDLTRHAVGRPRQWLPAHIIDLMLTFPTDPPGDCPHDEHSGCSEAPPPPGGDSSALCSPSTQPPPLSSSNDG